MLQSYNGHASSRALRACERDVPARYRRDHRATTAGLRSRPERAGADRERRARLGIPAAGRRATPDSLPLFNAHGDELHAALGVWRTADGTATFEVGPSATRVHAVFHHLIDNGRYSLFVRQLAGRTGPVFTPLDLTGAGNSFSADGRGFAEVDVSSPLQMPAGSQLVLVFHSDGADHRSSIGVLGTNAHPQLITRVP